MKALIKFSRDYGPTIGLFSAVALVAVFVAPLKTIPEDLKETRHEIKENRRDLGDLKTQNAATQEALRNLSSATSQIVDIMEDASKTREELGKHEVEIQGIKRRLDRIELARP